MWDKLLNSYNFWIQNRDIKGDYKFFVTKFDMCRRDYVGEIK